MKILLVEDHPELCEWLAKSLGQAGYVVEIADRGDHAEHHLLTGEYDGVLLDLSLPALARLSRPLLLARFFPEFYRARGQDERPRLLLFDLLAGLAVALATVSLGVMAAFALGEVDPAWGLAAGLLGGTITAGTHFAKAGSRLALNASPEPFSNWLASFSEEGMVLGGLWAMLASPLVFLGLLAVFMLIAGYVLFRLAGLLRRLFWRSAV